MYLDGKKPEVQQLKNALSKACIANQLVPVFCGSAYKNKGVQKLLDGVVEYLPAPTDVPDVEGTDEDGNKVR